MKIQKRHKASLLALMMLFGLPAPLMAADGNWDRMLDALHHDKAASHLSKQDRAALEATILLKAHRPEQAMIILDNQPDYSLIRQLRVQAAREHLVEVVRKAGGTRNEVKLPAASEKLNRALAEMDSRLNLFMQRLPAFETSTDGQSVQAVQAANSHSTDSGLSSAHQPGLTALAPLERWHYVLKTLQSNSLKVAKQLSARDRAYLQVAVLLKTRQPVQALKVLETQQSDAQFKYLKIHVARERIVEAVRKAGGNRKEVQLPEAPAGMAEAIAEMDAKLQSFVHQLAAKKTTPAMPISSTVRITRNNVATAEVEPKTKASVTASETAPVRVAHKAGEDVGVNKAINGMTSVQTPSPAVHDAVLQAVEAWRASWSNRDLDAYFSAYAGDFDVTDRFASMDAWKTYKRWVIGKRNAIQVTVELIKVHHVSEDQVRVEFLQHFRADSYQSDDLKALIFRQSDGGWKIIREGSA